MSVCMYVSRNLLNRKGQSPKFKRCDQDGLEEFYKKSKYYFKKYGHSKKEEDYVKKMIGTFGASYTVDYIK